MWTKHAHLLKPLSDKLGKKTFDWTPEMNAAFKIMTISWMWMSLWHTLATTYHSIHTPMLLTTKWCHNYPKKQPVMYRYHELTEIQQNHHKMVKELFLNVMILTEF